MMIRVSESGILERVEGEEDASVRGHHQLRNSRAIHDYLAAWPVGSSYRVFLFARANDPASVELLADVKPTPGCISSSPSAFPSNTRWPARHNLIASVVTLVLVGHEDVRARFHGSPRRADDVILRASDTDA